MGKKGSKLSEEATEISGQLVGRLSHLGAVTRKKMFGGYGIFESGVMFAMVNSDAEVYLRAADENVGRFEESGSEKFGRMPYWSLPDGVLENQKSLDDWARSSIKVAHSAKKQ